MKVHSQALFLTPVHNALISRDTLSAPMAQRRSNYPKLKAFGGYLAELRAGARLSTAGVSRRLADHYVTFGRSTLTQYEQGNVWAPDAVVLLRLADIYKTDATEIISVLDANRRNPDLLEIDVREILQHVRLTHGENAAAAARLVEIDAGLREIGERVTQLRKSAAVRQQPAVGEMPTTPQRRPDGRTDRRGSDRRPARVGGSEE